ncbi:uncharacterized protein (DUF305 family) [Krasilnikovia cinnamomea]|uniref:Uncharacterized protein (DUF305 family) n=1 Tax=Krasilnikovia cinnamomea TaxID=349313 RepID=A0A4Q7ZHR2_9ACTN|nr:DUF305 domain-containing protein [Krasilnikovia cinnamomea]RZU49964.1 uncharacterized protein (DUF305 family) [Krasilnikovia cinnamomea]
MDTDTDPDAAAPAASSGDEPQRPTRRRWGVGWIAATLVLGLVVGATLGLLIPHLRTPADDSVEAGFLRDMSTHHAQAVEMSMIAHANSTNPQIVTLAGDIALTQHQQIGYMQAWLRDWGLSPTSSQPPMAWMPDSAGSVVNNLMPGMATPEQMAELRKATGKDLDIQYLTRMRDHHLGGVHMAQAIIDSSDDEDVVWLAKTMVSGQQSELALINQMLAQLQQA